VTSVVGRFHLAGIDKAGPTYGGGSEYNLEIRSDNTWAVREYLTDGSSGGGGGCAAGNLKIVAVGSEGSGSVYALVPAAEQASFLWNYSTEVESVEVTIVNGVLHTVASRGANDNFSIDFEPDLRCFDQSAKTYATCSTLPNRC
jgi:hypothetical protein